MDHQQVLPPITEVGRDLRGHPCDEVHQVVPVLAGAVRPVGLLDDLPVDLQLVGLLAEGLDEQVVERDPLQAKPSQ